jgi:DNA-binding transcriptional LysR family regulator
MFGFCGVTGPAKPNIYGLRTGEPALIDTPDHPSVIVVTREPLARSVMRAGTTRSPAPCWRPQADTHRLRYFLSIAEAGSMTQAAAVLGVAQPALSRQVRLLEEDLGVTLFRRTSRGVQLTEEGERLRAATAGPLRQLELAIQYAGSPLARIERSVHLGLPPTAAGILAAPLLAAHGSAFQRASFQVTVAAPEDLIEGMLKGAVDIAVINPVTDDRVFRRDLLTEELAVIGGPESGLQPGCPVSFTELADLPLVLPGSPAGIRGTVENAALRLKVRIQSRYATDSAEVAKDLIAAGHAYGVRPGNRGRAAEVRGDIIREETGRLIKSGAWPARFPAPHRWDPSQA